MALTVLCKIFDVIHSADYRARRRLLRIMTDFSKNIGGFFVLFQALSVRIRLNATLTSVALGLHNSMNGYSSFIQSRDGCRANTMVCVDLAQACRE